jgi:hypothetical protein
MSMKVSCPIFVVGAPRSGTTLMQSVLMRLPGIIFPPETHFWGNVHLYRRQIGDLNSPLGWRRAVGMVLDFCCRDNELPVNEERLTQELLESERKYEALFDTLLRHVQIQLGECRRIGEKSPNHLLWADKLIEPYPDSKVIAMLRDGRDVAVSAMESLPGSELVQQAVRWARYERVLRRVLSKYPSDRILAVRYEDLVSSPEPTIRRVCEFLGEEFTEATLEPQHRKHLGFGLRAKHKMRTLEPITASRIGRFRQALNPGQIAMYQAIAGRSLRKAGYELEPAPWWKGAALVASALPVWAVRRLTLGRESHGSLRAVSEGIAG